MTDNGPYVVAGQGGEQDRDGDVGKQPPIEVTNLKLWISHDRSVGNSKQCVTDEEPEEQSQSSDPDGISVKN